MKRSAPLKREKSLTAKTGLKRTVALGRSTFARSALHARSAARKASPKRATPSIPAKVRAALKVRSGGVCEINAPGCTEVAVDPSHRLKTGMGGRKGADAVRHHVLSNLLHACRHCHNRWLHGEPAAAYSAGWMLREHQNPLSEPVVYRGAWCLLGDDGSLSPIDFLEEPMPIDRFRKKPVEVEATQWDGTAEGATPIIDWILAGESSARYVCSDPERCADYDGDTPHSIVIRTLEGNMAASVGDWIIRGVRGEFYPCKPEIFAATYEKAA